MSSIVLSCPERQYGLFQVIPSRFELPPPTPAEIAAKVDSEHGWHELAKVFHVLGQCRVRPLGGPT